MDESEVAGRIERIEQLLDQLERTPGATAAAAIEAVALVASVYGEALGRMAAGAGPAAEALAGDELVGHLMALHGVHPLAVEARVERALDEIRPYARSHGGDIELVAVDTGVATVKLSGSCDGCAASQATLEGMVRDAVLAAVPELAALDALPATAAAHPAPAAVPLALGARSGSAAGAGSAR
jgi:Fe-S cluster biogenesis protein NfuA